MRVQIHTNRGKVTRLVFQTNDRRHLQTLKSVDGWGREEIPDAIAHGLAKAEKRFRAQVLGEAGQVKAKGE